MKENEEKINTLLKKLDELKEGSYKYNNVFIEKTIRNSGFGANIIFENNKYEISYSCNGEYIINKSIDEYTTLYRTRNYNNIIYEFITAKLHNHDYNIYEKSISRDNEDTCRINNNEILKKLDDNTYISYDLNTEKKYVYYKKYNIVKESCDIDLTHIKNEYNPYFIEDRDMFNNKLKEAINFFIDDMETNRFKDLANTISIRPLKDNLLIEIEKIEEIGRVYNKYKNNFNVLNEDKNLENIISHITKLINNPYEAKENSIRNIINNIDLKDTATLINLRNEIESLIKYQKNTKRKTK